MKERTFNRTTNVVFRTDKRKREIIDFYLSHNYTKREVWKKFTGHTTEHGSMLRWMREMGYISNGKARTPMKPKKEEKTAFEIRVESERIRDLEQRLKEAEMKVIAFSKMIDIAEEELHIAIRKKYNTKP